MSESAGSMRAAVFLKPHEVEVQDRPRPEVGPEDVLIEVSHCGICGTDLHFVLEGMGHPNSVGGHEYSGRVIEVGSEISSSDWSVGDEVVGGPRPSCGECGPCQAGRASICEARGGFGTGDPRYQSGAFAEYTLVHGSALVRVPDGVTLRHAALTEPLAVALHAITVSGVKPGERALVTGAGPLGLLVIAALRAKGIDEVLVSEPAPLRAERAAKVGATRVCAPQDLEVPRMPFRLIDDPVDVVLECSGNPAAMEAGLAQLRRMGRLVFVGTGMRRPKLDHNRILMNELVVTGAYCYDTGGFDAALELLGSGALPNDLLIESHDVPLDGLLEAIESLGRGEIGSKVMIVPRNE